VTHNVATGEGGGIFIFDADLMVVDNSTIAYNHARIGGGYVARKTPSRITSSFIAYNSATLYVVRRLVTQFCVAPEHRVHKSHF
jgi:hypothetical protein